MRRSCRGDTMLLEAVFSSDEGALAPVDLMARARDTDRVIDMVRIVAGRSGSVPMRMSASFSLDYGRICP